MRPTLAISLAARSAALLLLAALLVALPAAAQTPDARALRRAQEMVRARAGAAQVATEMVRSYRQSPGQVAAIFHAVSVSATEAAPALTTTLRVAPATAATHMVRGGYDPPAATRALLRASAAPSDVAVGLRAAGVPAEGVAGSLRGARVTGAAATRALKVAGLGGAEAASGLLSGGYEPVDIRDALDVEFTAVTVPFLARALADQGSSVEAVAAAMAGGSRSYAQGLTILVEVGFDLVPSAATLLEMSAYASVTPLEVGQALASGQGVPGAELLATVQEILDAADGRSPLTPVPGAGLQRELNVPTVTAFNALRSHFGLDGPQTLAVAFEAGYPPDALAEGAVQALDLTLEAAAEALDGAGADTETLMVTLVEAEERGGRSSPAGRVVRGVARVFKAIARTAAPLVEVAVTTEVMGISVRSAVNGLLAGGPSFPEVLGGFLSSGPSFVEVLRGARDAAVPAQDATAALQAAGVSPAEAAQALAGAWEMSNETVAMYMDGAGYTAGQVAQGLNALGAGAADVARTLLNQGVDLTTVTRALDDELGLDSVALAQALADAGVQTAQIVAMLTEVQQLTHDTAMAVIAKLR